MKAIDKEQLEKLKIENQALKRKLKVADELNKEQFDLIIFLNRQIKGYESMNKARRVDI